MKNSYFCTKFLPDNFLNCFRLLTTVCNRKKIVCTWAKLFFCRYNMPNFFVCSACLDVLGTFCISAILSREEKLNTGRLVKNFPSLVFTATEFQRWYWYVTYIYPKEVYCHEQLMENVELCICIIILHTHPYRGSHKVNLNT